MHYLTQNSEPLFRSAFLLLTATSVYFRVVYVASYRSLFVRRFEQRTPRVKGSQRHCASECVAPMAQASGNRFSDLPEVIPRAEEEKQMVIASEKQARRLEGKDAFEREPGSLHLVPFLGQDTPKTRRKFLLWAACAAVVIIILGIALGVGLGVGLARGASSQ